jgi:predicted nucleotidyltransferase
MRRETGFVHPTRYALRSPSSADLLEAYLVGSRATGRAQPDSDFDIILLVSGDGALRLSDFEKEWSGRREAPGAARRGRLALVSSRPPSNRA